ncbi:hypothetical protein [Leifsonia sp. 1010]|uniref:hypothetical protein n=1 Tax=Leifsonia sp. 1010 TaxID=2817769 RepID=UPI0028590EC4|nr:hypothetical protein [Leifsonia sp. 1010]MDR6612968.1 hypothetical protein [Leifsonia sp. 1010]
MIREDDLRDLEELNPAAVLDAAVASRDVASRMLTHAQEAESAQAVFVESFRSRNMPDTVTKYLKPGRVSLERVHSTVEALCQVVGGAFHEHGALGRRRQELLESIQTMYSRDIPPLLEKWAAVHGGIGYPEVSDVPEAATLERNARGQVTAFNKAVEAFAVEFERSVRALRVEPGNPAAGPSPVSAYDPDAKAKERAQKMADWLESKLGTDFDNTTRLSEEDVAKLTKFLQECGGDQKAMEEFFGKIPPGALTNLLSGIGWGMAPSSPTKSESEQLLRLLQGGFALGTASWSKEKAKKFAKTFASAKSSEVAALGQLFNGPPFPGPEVSLAAARALQEREKKEGADMVFSFPPGSGTPFDATGAVFESLGQYPDQAYTFIDTLSYDDFNRLYRDRDWRDDGFAGVNALLFGANQATGGVFSHPTDLTIQKRIAELTSQGFDGLVKNKAFDASNVSADGSRYLAGTIGLNLPALTERPIGADPENRAPDSEKLTVAGLGKLFGSSISVDALIELLGIASSQPVGAHVLGDAISQYEQALLGLANSTSDPNVVRDALTLYGRLDGFTHGAIDAGTLSRATELDEENARAADTIAALLGLMPFPAASDALKLGGVFGEGLNLGQDVAMSNLTDAGADVFRTDHAAETLTQSRSDRDSRAKLSDYTVYGTIAETMHIPGVTGQAPLSTDPGTALSQVQAWLDANRSVVNQWVQEHTEVRADMIARDWSDAYGNAHDRGRP